MWKLIYSAQNLKAEKSCVLPAVSPFRELLSDSECSISPWSQLYRVFRDMDLPLVP